MCEQRKQPRLSLKLTIPTVSTSKPNSKHGVPVNSPDYCVKSKPKRPRMKRKKRLRGDELCQRSKGSKRIWNLQPGRGRRRRAKWGSCKSITTRVHSIRSVFDERKKKSCKFADGLREIGRQSAQQRLYRSDGKRGGHDPVTQGDASARLWKSFTNEIHPFGGPGYLSRWMGSGFEATTRSSDYRRRVLELWWSSSQKRSVLVNMSFICVGRK